MTDEQENKPPVRTWEDNADEFKELSKGEGWPYGALVACSVEPGFGAGNQSGVYATTTSTGKISAAAFARRAGCKVDRVIRYYRAWQYAAEKGLVPDAKTLTPADVHKVPYPTENGTEVAWKQMYATTQFSVARTRTIDASRRAAQAEAAAQAQSNPVVDEPGPERQDRFDGLLSKLGESPTTEPESPATDAKPEADWLEPEKPLAVTLPFALQEKLVAEATELGISYRMVVIRAAVEHLEHKFPPKL